MTEESDTERLRRKWEKHAPRYDRDMGFFERLQFGGGREWVCSQARGDVLEVAVGTGRNLPFYPDGVRLTGIDFSASMLEIARARAAGLGRPSPRCIGCCGRVGRCRWWNRSDSRCGARSGSRPAPWNGSPRASQAETPVPAGRRSGRRDRPSRTA